MQQNAALPLAVGMRAERNNVALKSARKVGQGMGLTQA